MKDLSILYSFVFEDNSTMKYQITLDQENLLFRPQKNSGPEWTKLQFKKCENCPFFPNKTPYCPVALNLAELVDSFSEIPSYKKAKVYVSTPERVYCKNTDVQTGLFSAFGAIMASSGCPHLDIFRPLVRFHLPFASTEETIFRAISMHNLNRYFEESADGRPMTSTFADVLNSLKGKYAEIEKVNAGMLQRVREIVKTDADKNALVGLNVFAQMFSIEFENNFIDSLASLFKFKNVK